MHRGAQCMHTYDALRAAPSPTGDFSMGDFMPSDAVRKGDMDRARGLADLSTCTSHSKGSHAKSTTVTPPCMSIYGANKARQQMYR
jgi:hypothetical protein